MPILIHAFDPHSHSNDLNSSTLFPTFWSLTPITHSRKRHFGGLHFKKAARREILSNDDLRFDVYRAGLEAKMDEYYFEEYYDHDDERFDPTTLRRPNWQSLSFPNCNIFHQIDLSRVHGNDANYDARIFDDGYYRDAWMIMDEKVVLKTLRKRHNFRITTTYQIQREAIIMERLTSSPRIMDIYGFCGSSVMVQPVPYTVEDYVIPGEGMMKEHDLQHDHDVLKPQNNFTSAEKLDMALQMAESIADLHGYEGGVIVHDDVQLCQWLRTSLEPHNAKLILGDFNRAEIMAWNTKEGHYEKYENGQVYGNYRAPEEIADEPLDEKIDVYSLGNNIYGLLTGLWVFYDTDDDATVQELVASGKRAFVDDRYRTRSFAEGKLVELMERCWIEDPAERIDIFEAVRFLRDAVRQNQKESTVLRRRQWNG